MKSVHVPPIGQLLVREIFSTIQGEGPFAGTPATFVRLGGCNLKCHFCDTDFDMDKADVRNVDEIVSECVAQRNSLVVLTGGEPMMQCIAPLILSLRKHLIQVQVETAGTTWSHGLTYEVVYPRLRRGFDTKIVVSPKTPKLHPSLEYYDPSYKYLISAKNEHTAAGIPITNTQVLDGLHVPLAAPSDNAVRNGRVYLQPLEEHGIGSTERNEANVKLAVELCMKHGYKLSLQLHKLLGLR